LYGGNYFWVFLYAGYTTEFAGYEANPYTYIGICSVDGENWTQRQRVASMTDQTPQMELGQTFDSRWDTDLGKIISYFPYKDCPYWVRFGTANGVLTRELMKCWVSVVNHNPVSPRYGYTQSRFVTICQVMHPSITAKRGDMICQTTKDLSTDGSNQAYYGWGSYANDTCQSVTLTWNETTAIYVTVKNDYTLWWNWAYNTNFAYPPLALSIKLAAGYNSLTGCSEPELNGYGNGTDEIVYIKDSGQLCLMSFGQSGWSSETVIVSSGATSPNIAVAPNGDRYISYIRQGRIYYKVFNVQTETLSSEVDLCPAHDYENPQYLSSNQMVQNGYICYTWAEDNPGGETPYGVWFAALQI